MNCGQSSYTDLEDRCLMRFFNWSSASALGSDEPTPEMRKFRCARTQRAGTLDRRISPAVWRKEMQSFKQ